MEWTAYVQKSRCKIASIWFGPFYPTVIVTHSSGVNKAMKLPKDRCSYAFFMPWLGEGLLNSEDKKWMRNRRLL